MNSSKKLIYIANLRLPTEKAYGIQIAKMCEAFSGLGLDVELVAPLRISKLKDDLFGYYGINKNFKFKKIFSLDIYLPGKFNVVALVLKNFLSTLILSAYSIFCCPDITFSRDELPIFVLSFLKKNLVYEAHRFSNSRRIFYRRFINRNVKVVVITKQLKEDFLKIGFQPKNVFVAPDGVDLEKFNIEISKEEARLEVGLSKDEKIIVYSGHLFEWKGARTLLEAAMIHKDILFVFVGGTQRDIEIFKKKAEGLGNVLILGHKLHKEIPLFLKAADLLVLPNSGKEEMSRFYTSPLKLFEFMASGRPIIASGLPSIKEILNNNNAFFFNPDDSASLANKIGEAFNSGEVSKKKAEQALRDAQNYTWQKRAKNILTYFNF